MEKYNVKKFDKIVRFFNSGGDMGEKDGDDIDKDAMEFLGRCHTEKVNFTLI